MGSSPTRRSKFSNLNLYNSPCVRAYGVSPPPFPFPKNTHTHAHAHAHALAHAHAHAHARARARTRTRTHKRIHTHIHVWFILQTITIGWIPRHVIYTRPGADDRLIGRLRTWFYLWEMEWAWALWPQPGYIKVKHREDREKKPNSHLRIFLMSLYQRLSIFLHSFMCFHYKQRTVVNSRDMSNYIQPWDEYEYK